MHCVPSSKAKATIQWEYQAMPDRTVWLFAIPRIAKELISHQDPAAELFSHLRLQLLQRVLLEKRLPGWSHHISK